MAKGNVAANVVKKLQDIGKKMDAGHVDVGWLEGATYPDGTPVASVMFWNEYGHGGRFPSPPRPAFRQMIAKEKPTWTTKIASLAKTQNYDGTHILRLMGEDIQGALMQSINNFSSPALSNSTLLLRERFGNSPDKIKFSDVEKAVHDAHTLGIKPNVTSTQAHPLIWTGHALNSTGYEVKR